MTPSSYKGFTLGTWQSWQLLQLQERLKHSWEVMTKHRADHQAGAAVVWVRGRRGSVAMSPWSWAAWSCCLVWFFSSQARVWSTRQSSSPWLSLQTVTDCSHGWILLSRSMIIYRMAKNNPLSHPDATLVSQARQARASGENLNYVILASKARQARSSGDILNYLLSC